MAPPPRRRGLLAAGVVVAVALVAVTVALAAGRGEGGDPDESADAEPTGQAAGADDPDDLAVVLADAGRLLSDAGTFSYEGTSTVEGPDPTGYDETMVTDRELTGGVELPDAARERVTESDGFTYERITVGSDVDVRTWVRDTAYPDQIDDRPWAEIDGGLGDVDVALLPDWLDAADDATDEGADDDGNRVVAAGVSPRLMNDLGPEMAVIDVGLRVTVDESGAPVRVELEVAATDTLIDADYEIRAIGDDVDVAPPRQSELDATPWVNEQDLAAFEGPSPLGLSHVPTGWDFAGAYVSPDPLGGPCHSATVDYTDLDDPIGQYLWIDVMDPGCFTPPPEGDAVDAAGFSGTVAEDPDGSRWGVVTSAEATVMFSTDLSVDDLRVVLDKLGPLDVAREPAQLDGIPSHGD